MKFITTMAFISELFKNGYYKLRLHKHLSKPDEYQVILILNNSIASDSIPFLQKLCKKYRKRDMHFFTIRNNEVWFY
jgi:hypothetical protein